MKKILILFIAMSCFLGMKAQSQEEWQEAIKALQKQRLELLKKYQNLKNRNEKLENRKFVTIEQSLRDRLVFYQDIWSMVRDDIFNKNPEFKKISFAKSYMSLIRMYNSLGKGYNQEENVAFKNELDSIREQVLSMDPKHKDSFLQSFDDLDNCIRNYRFAMFELARVFVLVKEKEEEGLKKASIYDSLKEDEETDFIDRIPYTKKQLDDYIKGTDNQRREIVESLSASCEEAFEKLKK